MRKILAVGIMLLFIGANVVSGFNTNSSNNSQPMNRGWFYVGGSGPGNYTRIQDAINDANDDDTIFVYNGTYYEHLIIEKAIALIGEDRNSTIVDGDYSGIVIEIFYQSILIQGFTVQNSGQTLWDWGIFTPSYQPSFKDIHIRDCIIKNNYGGIRFSHTSNSSITRCSIHNNLASCIDIIENSTDILISNCSLWDNGVGLLVGGLCYSCRQGTIEITSCNIYKNNHEGISVQAYYADIHHNIIDANIGKGIIVFGSLGLYSIKIHDNVISNSSSTSMFSGGILLQDCLAHVLIENNSFISNEGNGTFLLRSHGNRIRYNNYVGNVRQAFFWNSLFNRWSNNYYDDWDDQGPYRISGVLLNILYCSQFDWHPAQEPYVIPGMR